jgi:hypothetical protein
MASTRNKVAKSQRASKRTTQDLRAKKTEAVKGGALNAYLSLKGQKTGDIKGS